MGGWRLWLVVLLTSTLLLPSLHAKLFPVGLHVGPRDTGIYHVLAEVGPEGSSKAVKLLLDTITDSIAVHAVSGADAGNDSPYYSVNGTTLLPCVDGCNCLGGVCYLNFTSLDTQWMNGLLVQDVVTLSGIQETFKFLAYIESSEFYRRTQVSGLFGLGSSPDTGNLTTPSFKTFLPPDSPSVFSLCLGRFSGQLLIGGTDSALFDGDIQWVPLSNKGEFAFLLSDVSVSNVSLGLQSHLLNPVIINTRHLNILLPAPVLAGIRQIFTEHFCKAGSPDISSAVCDPVKSIFDQCRLLDQNTLSRMLNISFMLTGFELVFTPRDYLISFDSYYCFGFQKNPLPGISFGTLLMRTYYTVFDEDKQKLGFATARNCTGASFILERIEPLFGDRVEVAAAIPEPFQVRVLHTLNNNPAVGVEVRWTVLQGNGTLTDIQKTDGDGISKCTLWMGKREGIVNIVSAELAMAVGSPVVFEVEAMQRRTLTVASAVLAGLLVCALAWVVLTMRRREARRSDFMKLTFDDSAAAH